MKLALMWPWTARRLKKEREAKQALERAIAKEERRARAQRSLETSQAAARQRALDHQRQAQISQHEAQRRAAIADIAAERERLKRELGTPRPFAPQAVRTESRADTRPIYPDPWPELNPLFLIVDDTPSKPYLVETKCEPEPVRAGGGTFDGGGASGDWSSSDSGSSCSSSDSSSSSSSSDSSSSSGSGD